MTKWEMRAAMRMYEDMKTAEDAAEDIRRLYMRASLYIQSQGEGVFEAFKRETGLTEDEARYYLTQTNNPANMQAVIYFANQIQDKERKEAFLKWLAGGALALATLAGLLRVVDDLTPTLYRQEAQIHKRAYKKIINDAYLHKIFDIQQYTGYGKQIKTLDEALFEKLTRERWLGSTYSSRLWGNTNRLAEAVKRELMVSWLTGRPQKEAWQAIDNEFHKGQHAARRLIRTEANYMAGQAQLLAYKAMGVEKYIYVATLDLKTSEICRSLDGKVFNVKDAKVGENYHPMHPWCRSTTIAYIPPELLAKMERDAWNPKTGKHVKVPANWNYDKWYDEFVIG